MADSELPYLQKKNDFTEFIKTIISCLTLSHICILPIWDLVTGGSPRLFLLDESLSTTVILPTLTITFLIATLAFLSLYLHRNSPPFIGETIWILLITLAVFSICRIFIYNFFNKYFKELSSSNVKILIMLMVISILLSTLYFCKIKYWIYRSNKILLMISPLLIIIWVEAVFITYKYPPRQSSLLGKATSSSKSTIWVLIFDELDGKTILDAHPNQVGLREFAHWRDFSIVGTNAYPPAGATLWSIPALLQGRQIADTPSGMNYIKTWKNLAEAGKSKQWDWSDNLLTDASKNQKTSTLIAWGEFPYLPFYENSANKTWHLTETLRSNPTTSIPSFFQLFKTITLEVTIGPFKAAKMSRALAHTRVIDNIHSILNQLNKDNTSNIVWIHYPIPHYPSVIEGGSYLDNLRLTNQELRYFRELLQRKDMWDESTIIATGDHWFRKPAIGLPDDYSQFIRGFEHRWDTKDHRVPFFLKLPYQKTSYIHSNGFNTIILRKLIAHLSEHETESPEEISLWLDNNTSIVESPTTTSLP